MKFKQGWAVVLVAAVVGGIIACGKPVTPSPSGKGWKIDALRYNEDSEYYHAHITAIQAALRKAGYTEGKDYQFRFHSAQNELANVPQIVDAALTDQTDLILAFQAPVLYTAIKKAPKVNKVFAIINDPFVLGAGASDTEHLPFLTGYYERDPVAQVLALARECNPRFKRLGVLCMIGDAESEASRKALEQTAGGMGIEVVTQSYTMPSEVVEASRALALRKVDALIPLSDPYCDIVYSVLSKLGAERGIPLLGFWPQSDVQASLICINQGHQVAIDSYAQMVVRVLQGEDAQKIPFLDASARNTSLIVDLKAAKACGLDVPEAVQKRADEVIR